MNRVRPIHYEIEILFDALCVPLCENQRGVDPFEEDDTDVEMTTDDAQVTCRPCLDALGYNPERRAA